MKTSLKISAYGAALAVLVAGTYFVGTAVGPMSESSPAAVSAPAEHADDGHAHGRGRARPRRPRVDERRLHARPRVHDAGLGHLRLPDHRPRRLPGHRLRRGPRPAAAPRRRAPRRHGLPARAPRARRRGYLAGAADRPGRGRVPGVRRLQPDRWPGDHARRRPVRARRLPAGRARADPLHHRRRLHRDPRRRPRGRRRVTAHAHRQPRRCARRRAALPRRVRPPRGPARAATSPTCTCTPAPTPRPGPRSGSTPRCPARAPTGCSSTSRSTAWCARPTSRW